MRYVYGIAKGHEDPVVFFVTRSAAYRYARKYGAPSQYRVIRAHWTEALLYHTIWHKMCLAKERGSVKPRS